LLIFQKLTIKIKLIVTSPTQYDLNELQFILRYESAVSNCELQTRERLLVL